MNLYESVAVARVKEFGRNLVSWVFSVYKPIFRLAVITRYTVHGRGAKTLYLGNYRIATV